MNLSASVKFYLKHQKPINEWYQIKDEAVQEWKAFFKNLAQDIRILSSQLSTDVKWNVYEDKMEYYHLLCKPEWADAQTRPIRVGVGLGASWGDEPLFERAYCGIVVFDRSPTLAAALENQLRTIQWDYDLEEPDNYWPTWRQIASPEAYWQDLPAYKHFLTHELEDTWKTFEKSIDLVIQQAG